MGFLHWADELGRKDKNEEEMKKAQDNREFERRKMFQFLRDETRMDWYSCLLFHLHRVMRKREFSLQGILKTAQQNLTSIKFYVFMQEISTFYKNTGSTEARQFLILLPFLIAYPGGT